MAACTVRGFVPGKTVKAYRRVGDWIDPRWIKGLGDPIAEATADEAGEVTFGDLPPGLPLVVAGPGYQGPVARKTSAAGVWDPQKEEGPTGANARQLQSSNVSEHARHDEDPRLRSTAVHRASDTRDLKPRSELTGEELRAEARRLGIKGRSKMSVTRLRKAVLAASGK
jgi:hypothetical protein